MAKRIFLIVHTELEEMMYGDAGEAARYGNCLSSVISPLEELE